MSFQSLTLLEYLLKTGDDRVLLKMKDNIYIVKALTEYRFVEKDGKDQVIRTYLMPKATSTFVCTEGLPVIGTVIPISSYPINLKA